MKVVCPSCQFVVVVFFFACLLNLLHKELSTLRNALQKIIHSIASFRVEKKSRLFNYLDGFFMISEDDI